VVDTQPSAELIQLLPHAVIPQPIRSAVGDITLGASSALAWDISTASYLYTKNADKKLPIASLTKLMTVLVILKEHQLTEVVTVANLPSYNNEDAKLGLTNGQKFALKDLLAAALIPSANDAADALALWDSGTIPAFSAKMNRLAAEWGISDVRFTNPSGLSDEGNYATAYSLAKIGKLALTNPTVKQLVGTGQMTINDSDGKSYALVSTDQLLVDPRVSGIKTGFTAVAGQCFMSLSTINGHQVITVVLASPDRFGETLSLINWIEKSYTWQ
jgi:serine-type D-Ala-D-Ala carboxypeptidase (penicillin-binding protein 5/6)